MAVIAETQRGPIHGREKDDVLLFAGIPSNDPDGTGRDAWDGLR